MKFEEVLKRISYSQSGNRLIRKNWPYYLMWNYEGYLTLCDHQGELSTYAINKYDFDYDWDIS